MQIIDCDIHPNPSAQFPLEPFVAENFRQAVAQGQAGNPIAGYLNPFGVNRRDIRCEDPAAIARDHLDLHHIAYGILQPPGISVSLIHNLDVGSALARAWNDWQIENYLSADRRFLGSICINVNDPLAAAREIRRVGRHSQMVQTVTTGETTHLFGHRVYDPVYEACQEMGLAFAVHPGNEGARTPSTPIGMPSSYFEWHTTLPLTSQAHTVSLVAEGTFERFPTLKVIIIEAGFGWLAPLMWRMDKNFKALRSTIPWLRRLPSEYIVDHIRLTTQPIEEPPREAQLLQMFEMISAEKTLCFASDFPHWDFDDPIRAFPARMPSELKERIFYANAAELYGLPKFVLEAAA